MAGELREPGDDVTCKTSLGTWVLSLFLWELMTHYNDPLKLLIAISVDELMGRLLEGSWGMILC